jgi:prepilin-type N-terminal cleavage/methylation domain-containing protein
MAQAVLTEGLAAAKRQATMKIYLHSTKESRGIFSRVRRGAAGFTLAEVMIAVGIAGIFSAACLSSIVVNQVVTRKSKEEALAMDFLMKYAEHVKALPFDSVLAGQPVNYLYNGSGGAASVTIPSTSAWVSINNTNYQTFYPDLLWFTNRNPQLKVVLTTRSVSGVVHDKEINAHVAWDSPLGKGGRLEVQVDLLRTANVPTL